MDYTKFNQQTIAAPAASYNEGLRNYMLSVYNYMAIALVITGLVAFLVSSSPALTNILFNTPLFWVVAFAPLIMVFFLGSMIMRLSLQGAQMAFWSFAALMGVSLASIFLVYTGESIARTFFISASIFGAMSLYGYTTKKDISSWGSFLMMGVIGLIVASIVNIFLQSTMMHFVTSVIGVLIFTAFTAYDTQRIKEVYYQVGGNNEIAAKVSILGALSLYMDLLNLAIYMLQFFGQRRD